jgi:hypothetical protein
MRSAGSSWTGKTNDRRLCCVALLPGMGRGLLLLVPMEESLMYPLKLTQLSRPEAAYLENFR